MAGIKYNHNMFTVGMISQKIQGNTESETYNNALLDCKNFYIRQTGGVFKRPGTYYVSVVPRSQRMQLYPFNFADDNSIIIGLIPGYIYAYNTDGQVTSIEASVLTTSVLSEEYTVLQQGDSIYLFCIAGIYEIKYDTVTRTLSFAEKEFTFPPVGEVNVDKNNTATYDGTSTITLTGTKKFVASDVGQKVLLMWVVKEDPGDGQEALSYMTSSYFTIGSIDSSGLSASVTWESDYSSYTETTKIPTDSTTFFALPAFGANREFPVAAGVLAGRLYLADSHMMIYGSAMKFNDIFSFEMRGDESTALSYRLNNDVGRIHWIVGQDKLFVGTPTGIFISGGAGVYQDEVITAANFTLKKFSSVHANRLPPTNINANIVFADALGKNIYEIAVDETTGTYKTYDLSILSNELLNSGCISQTWSSYPVKTYWVATAAGILASMTYEKASNVLAWSYHDLGGENVAVESVATIQKGGYDYVFCVVRRNVKGEIVRSIEYIDKLYEPLDNKQYEQHYVDCGLERKYTYVLRDITQYKPPQIEGVSSWAFGQIAQNEDAKTQYTEMALIADNTNKVSFDYYPEETWSTTFRGEDIIHHVTFCRLKEEKKSVSVDGIERTTYRKVTIDNHEVEAVFGDAQPSCRLAIMKERVLGVKYDTTSRRLVLILDAASFAVDDYIILRDTGIETDAGSADSREGEAAKFFKVLNTDASAFTEKAGIIIGTVGGADPGYVINSFNPGGERKIYRLKHSDIYTLTYGQNTIAKQGLDATSAVAISDLPKATNMPQNGVCAGVVWENDHYVLAQGRDKYNIAADFKTWTKFPNAWPSDAKAFVLSSAPSIGEVSLTVSLIYFGAWDEIQGIFRKFTGLNGNGSVAHFLVGEKAGRYRISMKRYLVTGEHITAELIDSDTSVQVFKEPTADGIPTAIWGNSSTEFSNEGLIPDDDRVVNAGIKLGNNIYIVGTEGLFYTRPANDYNAWTAIINLDRNQVTDWEGVTVYDNKLLLWSKSGELMLYNPANQTDFVQTLAISSTIAGCYVANNVLFVALSDGRLLRSLSDSQYTLTFFDLSYVYIDDVVGMEGINAKKLQVRNIDTTNIRSGTVSYEVWEDGHPLDTRPFGVYDKTVLDNGTVHVYFNKAIGLGQLAGQKVSISLDGNFLRETIVSSDGTVSLGDFGMEAHIGYSYEGVLELMPLSGGNMRGSSVGSVGSQKPAFARLYYSLGGKYGTEEDNMYKIIYPTRLLDGSYDTTKKLYNGLIELPLVNPKDVRERRFRMEQSEPVSFNVLSVAQDAEISDA